ncbi:MAG: 16S rRNA (uracil(1498)-N(3))-methyltransferase [Deltaproteobacteria bacterium]|nr:16S rRNA (uracil(1498)-N(3))-methyltransferase [Deltaproteobacteria bacterium]
MSRIFVNQNLKPNSSLILAEEEHHYIKNVLRMNVGDPLYLFNGGEEEFSSKITAMDKNTTTLQVLTSEKTNKESSIEIVIGQGLPKGSKFDNLIPKVTELGASELVPLITERSDLKKASQQKVIRWQKIAQQSAQQTGRTKVPTISPPISFTEFLNHYPAHEKIMFYELEASKTFTEILSTSSASHFCLLIGPEGGFSPQEIAQAQKAKFHIVSLGKRILRTETVAPAVTAILQYVKGDLNRV